MPRSFPLRHWVWLAASLLHLGACDRNPANSGGSSAEARDPLTGLTAVEAAEVLATVGDHKITLGEYAHSLARMDEFERLRYQSEERQRQLLNEMIDMEVLAQEAKRRGLDRDPKVQLQLMQALRNEVLEDLRQELPKPAEIPESEVSDYYKAHRGEFVEPERRRVLVLELGSEALAAQLSAEAQGATGQKWAELAQRHSARRERLGPEDANELAGDLGFVSAPGEERGKNELVPEAVRSAVFELGAVGDVAPRAVSADGKFYVVRLGAISPARNRSLGDAGPAIRAELLRQKFKAAEQKLLVELERRFPASIDEAALQRAAQGKEP